MALRFERVRLPQDRGRLVSFLTNDEWPFHGRAHMDERSVDITDFLSSDAENHWIADDVAVGPTVRAFPFTSASASLPIAVGSIAEVVPMF